MLVSVLRRHAAWAALAAGLPLTTVPVFAAEDLGRMVISANRTETPIDQVGSSVTVVTAEEIEKAQATTALDVLRDVPGVTVGNNGGPGTSSWVTIRGMTDAHILVMIDGVAVGNPSDLMKAGGYDLTNILASDIERVEVLRGNQSTLYGSRAMGGVISITTKTGKNDTKPFAGSGSVEVGSYNTKKSDINAHGRLDDVYYNVAATKIVSSGFDISGTRDGSTEADGYDNTSFNTTVGADVLHDVGVFDKVNVEGAVRYTKGWADTDGSKTGFGPLDALSAVRTVENGAQMKLNADMFQGVLANAITLSRSEVDTDYYSYGHTRNPSGSMAYDGDTTTFGYQGTLKPLDGHTVVFGYDHTRDHISTYNIMSGVSDQDYFGNYQLALLDDTLTLTAGGRVDDHETFGTHATYRGTAGYRIPATGTRLHASYGTGFKAPTVYQLYGPDTVYTMGGVTSVYKIGNADLQPEESRGYDVGVEQSFFGDRVVVDSTFFNNSLTNMFSYSQARGYYNTTSARTFGFENTLTARLTDEWRVSASHTYTQARDNNTGRMIASQPHHEGNLRIDYSPDEVKGLDLWTRGRFATTRYDSNMPTGEAPFVAGWAVWDAGGSYAITDYAKVFGRVENLFDKDYYTKSYYANPGRGAYAGLRISF